LVIRLKAIDKAAEFYRKLVKNSMRKYPQREMSIDWQQVKKIYFQSGNILKRKIFAEPTGQLRNSD
jgi:hypothetical protein